MADVTSGWKPTHKSPREGMDAWAEPDPSAQPSSELDGRVDLQLLDTAGEWAKMRGANGWEGWVDGRLLEQLAPPGVTGDQRAYVLLAIAVVVLVVIAVMGWTS